MPTDRFALDLRASLTPWNHLAAASGRTCVQPLPRCVTGVGEWFAPPVAARGFALRTVLLADGARIVDDGNRGKGDCGLLWAGGRWLPDRIERHGTYHQGGPDGVRSLAVSSRLTPLADGAGFVLAVTVRNRGTAALGLDLAAEVDPGRPRHHPLAAWDYGVPAPAAAPAAGGPAGPWQGDGATLRLWREGGARRLEPGAEATWRLAVAADGAAPGPAGLAGWEAATAARWRTLLDATAARFPRLAAGPADLRAWWDRSWISFLMCLWSIPGACMDPFVATSGLDGGAICAYPWDVGGYAPLSVAQALGPGADALLDRFAAFGLDAHSRFTPAGNGTDVPYAYNAFSAVALLWGAACHRGPDRRRFAAIRDQVLAIDAARRADGALVDWGVQHNLLEMRQRGWEHLVASPNAERAWCLDRLADLADALGEPGAAAWRAQARGIRAEVRARLWDGEARWFRCLHPDGGGERVLSIQAFDAWRALDRDPAIDGGLLHHLRHSGFLGAYGVSSIAAADAEHYELNDPDWSGGGAYSGDGPLLALTLWEKDQPELAWEVLRRHFWMGRHLACIPQEHCCDRPEVPAHKRANIVAAIAGNEAVVHGLFGLDPRPDGSLRWRPAPCPCGEPVRLEGYAFRGRRIDAEIAPDGARAWVDGVEADGAQLVSAG